MVILGGSLQTPAPAPRSRRAQGSPAQSYGAGGCALKRLFLQE